MTLAATPVAAGEAKDDQASEGDDDDWANWVREHLLAIMLKVRQIRVLSRRFKFKLGASPVR